MPVNERILRILSKLKNMTVERGCTPAEAASAAAKVQELLHEHQLTMLDIKEQKLNEELISEPVSTGKGRRNPGLNSLSVAIAKGMDCQVVSDYVNGSIRYNFLGYLSDVKVCVYLFAYLQNALVEAASVEGRRIGVYHQQLIKFRNSYLMGAASEIKLRLLAQKKKQEQTDTAMITNVSSPPKGGFSLVLIKEQPVADFVKLTYPKLVQIKSKASFNQNAYNMGKEKGRSIALNQALEGNQRRLE